MKEISIKVTDGNGLRTESILKKLDSIGANPSSSCRQGHCGDCAMKLKDGETEYFEYPLGYCHDGEILTCISHLKSVSIILE